MASDHTYNGWTNYETWNLSLWIDNDEGSYNYWREIAREMMESARADATFSRRERAILDLSDRLKEETEEGAPTGECGFYTDVLNAAISQVNWYEIAEHWIDEIADEFKDEDEEEN